MYLVGLCGKMYAGKTAFAESMCLHAADDGVFSKILPFAQPLKQIARSMGWDGNKDEKGRRLLQLLGTECMRECIDPNGWLKLWIKEARSFQLSVKSTALVISDDCRFSNEAGFIHPRGMIFDIRASAGIRRERAEAKNETLPLTSHASELGLPEELIHYVIYNDGTLDDLGRKAFDAWKHVKETCLSISL